RLDLSLPAEPFRNTLTGNGRGRSSVGRASRSQKDLASGTDLPLRDSRGQSLVKSGTSYVVAWTHLDSIIPQFFSPVSRRLGGKVSRREEGSMARSRTCSCRKASVSHEAAVSSRLAHHREIEGTTSCTVLERSYRDSGPPGSNVTRIPLSGRPVRS